MSFFTGIEKAEHSTVAWIEKEVTLFEKKEPTIARVVDAGLTYIGPVLQIGLTAIGDPAAAALVTPILARAHADLLAASALVTDFGPTPTAASVFASVQTNLSDLLAAGQVKSRPPSLPSPRPLPRRVRWHPPWLRRQARCRRRRHQPRPEQVCGAHAHRWARPAGHCTRRELRSTAGPRNSTVWWVSTR